MADGDDIEALATDLANTDGDWRGMDWRDWSEPVRNIYRKQAAALILLGWRGQERGSSR